MTEPQRPLPIVETYDLREPVKHSSMFWGDPVEQWSDGKWYFWNETWDTAYGPFNCEYDALEASARYGEHL